MCKLANLIEAREKTSQRSQRLRRFRRGAKVARKAQSGNAIYAEEDDREITLVDDGTVCGALPARAR
jgi:hypothetical protein